MGNGLDESVDGDEREILRDRYLDLTRSALPIVALREKWIVRDDHCFMRIILDHVCGECWYDHLDRRYPAYKQLGLEQLRTAVSLGESMLNGPAKLVAGMNRQSLIWRGQLK